MTISDCKEAIAKKHGHSSWERFIWSHFAGNLTPRAIDLLWEEVCELYASENAKSDGSEKRISLDEQDFTKPTSIDVVTKKSVDGTVVKIALQDIGYDRLIAIIENNKFNSQ